MEGMRPRCAATNALHGTPVWEQIVPKASNLRFEFSTDATGAMSASASQIHLPAVHKLQEGQDEILKQLVERYKVPEKHRYGGSTEIADGAWHNPLRESDVIVESCLG